MIKILFLGLFIFFNAFASNEQDFIKVISKYSTIKGSFSQVTTDKFNNITQLTSGKFIVKKPTRFIWQYDGEDGQKIISTGSRVWLIEDDLKKVSHVSIDNAIEHSPISILLSSKNLTKFFKIIAKPSQYDLSWVELIPKNKENIDFEKLEVGYDKKSIKEIKLENSFNQKTIITLINLQFNIKLEDWLFNYQPKY